MSNYDYDDECFDIDSSRSHPAPSRNASPQEALQAAQGSKNDLAAERARQAQVFYLTLLCQNGPVTEVTSPVVGTLIEDEYVELYKNNTNNPVRVQAFADLITPGCGAILSLTRDKGDQGKVDVLALVANGRTESVQVILMPTTSLWVRNFRFTAFPMTVDDTIRVRVFDPMKLLSFNTLYPMSKY